MNILLSFLFPLFGYLCGSLPFSIWITRFVKNVDVPNAGMIIGRYHVRCFIAFSLFVVGISDYKTVSPGFRFPYRHWKDHPTGEPFEGPITLRDYPAPLEKLPLL